MDLTRSALAHSSVEGRLESAEIVEIDVAVIIEVGRLAFRRDCRRCLRDVALQFSEIEQVHGAVAGEILQIAVAAGRGRGSLQASRPSVELVGFDCAAAVEVSGNASQMSGDTGDEQREIGTVHVAVAVQVSEPLPGVLKWSEVDHTFRDSRCTVMIEGNRFGVVRILVEVESVEG